MSKDTTQVLVKKVHKDAVIPSYAHETDAGFDLYAVEDTQINPGETKVIRTGLLMQVNPKLGKYEIQIRPRSGVSSKTKLRVANSPGTVDQGFTGEIGVIMDNIFPVSEVETDEDSGYEIHYPEALNIKGDLEVSDGLNQLGTYIIRKGDRIAQGVLKRVETGRFREVSELMSTDRGENGYGSTGSSYPEFICTSCELLFDDNVDSGGYLPSCPRCKRQEDVLFNTQ